MNGIYLHLLLREIKDRLVGLCIDEILLKERIVQCVFGRSALYICLYPDARALYIARTAKVHYDRLSRFNTALESRIIKSVSQDGFQPVVRLAAEKHVSGEPHAVEIIISLYKEAPNVSLKTTDMLKNLFPRFIEKKRKKNILELDVARLRTLIQHKASLVRDVEGIDKYLAEELTYDNIETVRSILAGARVKPKLVSVVPLQISLFAHKYIETSDSFNTLYQHGIHQFLEMRAREHAAAQKRNRIRTMQRKLNVLKEKLLPQNEIEACRIAGELLLSSGQTTNKGAQSTRLFNPYDGKEIVIALDPRLTIQQNAQAYFRKYKKYKRGRPIIKKKIGELEKDIKKLEDATHAVSLAVRHAVKKEKVLPFRVFKLESGAAVYVGKSAKSNDELTFKFARPHDYFFHTRGFEGAHTVLRVTVPKGQRPQRKDMRTAAAIAAYYSKARKQRHVVVSYTQRKYLKKDKKGGHGSVIFMREETLFVDPKLPE